VLDAIFLYDRKVAIHGVMACIDQFTLPDVKVYVYEHTDTHSQRGGTLQPRLYYPGVCWGPKPPRHNTHRLRGRRTHYTYTAEAARATEAAANQHTTRHGRRRATAVARKRGAGGQLRRSSAHLAPIRSRSEAF